MGRRATGSRKGGTHRHPTELSQAARQALGVDQLANEVRAAVAQPAMPESLPAPAKRAEPVAKPKTPDVWHDSKTKLVTFSTQKMGARHERKLVSLSEEALAKSGGYDVVYDSIVDAMHVRIFNADGSFKIGFSCPAPKEEIVDAIATARANYFAPQATTHAGVEVTKRKVYADRPDIANARARHEKSIRQLPNRACRFSLGGIGRCP